jgi:hypothetical protein
MAVGSFAAALVGAKMGQMQIAQRRQDATHER